MTACFWMGVGEMEDGHSDSGLFRLDNLPVLTLTTGNKLKWRLKELGAVQKNVLHKKC